MSRALCFVAVLAAMLSWAVVAANQLSRPGEGISLQGTISSQAEGQMEGVLVSAKEVGGIITVTVVSDADGQYRFPANRLGAGTYNLSIRAAGYDLTSPSEVKIVANKTTQTDLKLTETKNLTSQLMNAEWLLSVEKSGASSENIGKLNCVGCHSLTKVMLSKHTAEDWPKVLQRMKTYGAGGQKLPYDPSQLPISLSMGSKPVGPDKEFLKFLASINLSSGDKHSYELLTLPRPTGRATKVIITEYDLPNKRFEPHELLVDPDGMVWTTDFVGPNLIKFDLASRQFTEYQMPLLKPDFPKGNNCLEIDKAGDLWWVGLKQGGVYKFSPKTEKFDAWKLPTGDSVYSHNGCLIVSPDGTVWNNEQSIRQVQRLHPDTGEYTLYDPFPKDMTVVPAKNPQPQGVGFLGGRGLGGDYSELAASHSMYGSAIDSKGIFYVADIGAGYIVKIIPDTKAVTLYQTPTPNSAPRKIQMDSQDRLWIGEYRAGKISMFDTRTTEWKEWDLNTPYHGTYDAGIDKHGNVWSGGMHTDYLTKLDPGTGEVTNYLLPSLNLNIRSVGGMDNRTTPASIWVGQNHVNKIARVEFLD